MKSGTTRLGLALISLWLLLAGVASAADVTPPVIGHTPVTQAVSDSSLTIGADVTDDERVRRVVLYMRAAGTSSYFAIPMNVQGTEYRGVIPANFVTVGTLEYYIEATDTSGNIKTAPATNAAAQPYRVEVLRDDTTPDAELKYPVGAIRGDSVVVVILLRDEGKNIDPGSVQVLLNGRDITAEATITPNAVTYVASAQDLRSISALQVRVRDRAGNEITKRFRVYKLPEFAGRAEFSYTSKDGASDFGWNLSAEGGWGPFFASAKLDGDDPMFTGVPGQPTNSFRLAYDSRIVDVQVGDVVTTISPLVAQDVNHRGYNAYVDLGVLETTIGSGLTAHEVAGETYARRFLGLRQELDLWLLRLGLNASELIDDNSAAGIAVDPEQNYVVSMDLGAGLGRIQAGAEIGMSMLFPNAQGNLWASLDDLKALPSPMDQMAEILGRVPPVVQRYLPLPHPDYWLLDTPYIDVGAQVKVSTPLPWSAFEASYYRVGPDFRTVAGQAEADREGLSASWKTARLFNVIALGASYEDYQDNVQSMLDLAAGSPAPSEADRNRFIDMGGELSLRSRGGVTLGLSAERKSTNQEKDVADLGVDQSKDTTDTYGVELKNIRLRLGDSAVTLGGGLTQATFSDLVTPANDKVTTTAKISTRLGRGPWTYSLGYTDKREVDAAGDAVNSPTLALGAAWSARDVTFGGMAWDRVRAGVDSSFGSSSGTGVDSTSTVHTVRVRLNPTANTEWSLQYKVKSTADRIAGTSGAESTLRIGYALNF